MKSLLLITHEYPLKQGDASFIENEIPHLARAFDAVHVLCLKHKMNSNQLCTPQNVHINFISDNKYNGVLKYVSLFALPFHSVFYRELISLTKTKKLSAVTLRYAIGFLRHAIFLQIPIKHILKNDKTICLIYTYWYTHETLSALLLKSNITKKYAYISVSTRTHRYDLYKLKNNQNWQSYKQIMDEKIDKIFFISQHGYNYYINEFAGNDLKKYELARLGVSNKYDIENTSKNGNNDTFVLCSCSYIVPVKRVYLIAEALEKINNYKIHWVHIGDGFEENTVKSLSAKKLSGKTNISYEFKGFMKNEQIMRFYNENNIDCFISTSESEGLPVSMMEAISFGIPIIATAVGGVPEIVNKNFGILLNPVGDVFEISDAIIGLCNLRDGQQSAMRQSARSFWETNFNAEVNHAKFSQKLLTLVNGKEY